MSKKYRRIKKTLALTLALVMVLGILPLGSVASATPGPLTIVSVDVDDKTFNNDVDGVLKSGTAGVTFGGELATAAAANAWELGTEFTAVVIFSDENVGEDIPVSVEITIRAAEFDTGSGFRFAGDQQSITVSGTGNIVPLEIEIDDVIFAGGSPPAANKQYDGTEDAEITNVTFKQKAGGAALPETLVMGDDFTAVGHYRTTGGTPAPTARVGTGLTIRVVVDLLNANYVFDEDDEWDDTPAAGNITAMANQTGLNVKGLPASGTWLEVGSRGVFTGGRRFADGTIVTTDKDIEGQLSFYRPGTGGGGGAGTWVFNNSMLLGDSDITAGMGEIRWEFVPSFAAGHEHNPGYGTMQGSIPVNVHDGIVLPPNAIDVKGLGRNDNKINLTYTGTGLGFIDEDTDVKISVSDLNPLPPGVNQNMAGAADISTQWTFEVRYNSDPGNVPAAIIPSNSPDAPTDAGKYFISILGTANVTGLHGGNYRVERVIELNIEPRVLRWGTGVALDKVYDGTTEVTIFPALAFTNVFAGDATTAKLTVLPPASLAFASANVGTHPILSPAPISGWGITGTAAHNYELPRATPPTFGTATIKPLDIVIVPDPLQNKAYMDRDVPLEFSAPLYTPVSSLNYTLDQLIGSHDGLTVGVPTSGRNRNDWLGRAEGTELGEYAYVLNTSVISNNFNVSIPAGMSHKFTIRPTALDTWADNGGYNNAILAGGQAGLMAYEAYEAWETARSTQSASAQPLVDVAIGLGRLPSNVSVNTESEFDNRWGENTTYSVGLPMGWSLGARGRVNTAVAGALGGATYDVLGSLDLSANSNVVNPDRLRANGVELTVTQVVFDGSEAHNDFSNFAPAYVLLGDNKEARASDLPDLLPEEGYLTFGNDYGGGSASVRYTVVWNNNTPRLDMTTHGAEQTFTGTIRLHSTDAPNSTHPLWLTLTGGMTIQRTITAVEVLPITIGLPIASNSTYNNSPWSTDAVPEVRVNGQRIPDQPPASAFIWAYEGTDGSSGWGRRYDPPVDAGTYKAVVSIASFGNYERGSAEANFTINRRNITINATSETVDKGAFVGGGSPNIGFTVDGLADGDTVRDALFTNPTLRINGFDGSKVGSYDLVFTQRGVVAGTGSPAANTGPQNYNIAGWEDGKIHVVEPSAPTFRVSVVGGTVAGGGSFAEYAAGTVVTITANSPAAGSRFAGWTSTPSVSFASATPTTTFTMPAGEVAVSATFERIPTSTTPVIPKEPIFPDLTSGPAFNAVQWAATMRIIEGRDGLFHPKAEMTRSQIVVILHRYAGRENVSSTVSFTDVTPGTTIGRAVAWAVSNDIATGRSDTVFGVNDIISRESLMVMLYRYHTRVLGNSGAASANALARFSDSGDVSSTALNAIRWAVENGLLTGQGGKILPKASMTRDQLVTILYRYDKAFN